jgi:ornithine decarboxylase
MGGGFDCASQQEIEQALKAGAKPSDIIYANPAKPKQHLLYAKQHGVLRMTFDNKDELEKIATIFPEAKLVLRLLPDDSHSSSPLGTSTQNPASVARTTQH